MPTPHTLQGIYAISDEILTPYHILPYALEAALKAGVSIFQLRDKTHSDTWLLPHARILMEICAQYHALFVLNDRVELALALQAPALHIGRNDAFRALSSKHLDSEQEHIAMLRSEFLGILGISSYGDIQRALLLESLGADYVAFGAFFPSPSKPNAPIAPLQILTQAKPMLYIPICAIGGIHHTNIHLLSSANMHAVISSLWGDSMKHATKHSLSNITKTITHNVTLLRDALHHASTHHSP